MSKVTQILTPLTDAIKAVKPEGGGLSYKALNGFFKQKNAECKALLTELENTKGVLVEKIAGGGKKIKGTHPEYGAFEITRSKSGDVLAQAGKIETVEVKVGDKNLFSLKKSQKQGLGENNEPKTFTRTSITKQKDHIFAPNEVYTKEKSPSLSTVYFDQKYSNLPSQFSKTAQKTKE